MQEENNETNPMYKSNERYSVELMQLLVLYLIENCVFEYVDDLNVFDHDKFIELVHTERIRHIVYIVRYTDENYSSLLINPKNQTVMYNETNGRLDHFYKEVLKPYCIEYGFKSFIEPEINFSMYPDIKNNERTYCIFTLHQFYKKEPLFYQDALVIRRNHYKLLKKNKVYTLGFDIKENIKKILHDTPLRLQDPLEMKEYDIHLMAMVLYAYANPK